MDYESIRREYIHGPLTLETMDKDPMVEFQRWFDLAYKYFSTNTNAMSLATVNKNGRPTVRTVLLKGTTQEGFLFYTNYNSQKGQDLEQNPYAALLFYWPGLDRQIRIEGTVNKVSEELSEKYFKSRPIGSQISAVASPQSKRISMKELKKRWLEVEKSKNLSRPKHWGGYVVKAEYIEFWNGRENRFHDRFIYDLNSQGVYDRYRIAP